MHHFRRGAYTVCMPKIWYIVAGHKYKTVQSKNPSAFTIIVPHPRARSTDSRVWPIYLAPPLVPLAFWNPFGPPGSGSGSVSKRYGSGSGSFHHQAKIVRKTFISTVLWLWLFIFEEWCKCTFKSNKEKYKKKIVFRWRPLARGADPDPGPYHNVTDPEHWPHSFLLFPN